MQAKLTILGKEIAIACAPEDVRRLEDLAASLSTRLAAVSGDADETRRLVLTALALMDETQATYAALVRARCEIERLTDMVVEAKLGAQDAHETDDRGRVGALRRVAEGAA